MNDFEISIPDDQNLEDNEMKFGVSFTPPFTLESTKINFTEYLAKIYEKTDLTYQEVIDEWADAFEDKRQYTVLTDKLREEMVENLRNYCKRKN